MTREELTHTIAQVLPFADEAITGHAQPDLDAAREALSAIEAAGFRIVPAHPSAQMKVAGAAVNAQGHDFAHETWSQMLRASPLAAPGGQDGR